MHVCAEICGNTYDELGIKNSVGHNMTVSFDDVTKECTVIDDGRGIPLGKLYEAFTVISASGKFDNNESTAYTTSGGVFGAGACTATYLSKSCEVTSTREGKFLTYRFKDGILVDTEKGTAKGHGTTVKFTIDQAFCDVNSLTSDDIKRHLQMKSYLFPDINTTLIQLKKGKKVKEWKFSGADISDWVADHKPDTEIIRVKDTGTITYLKRIDDKNLTTNKIDVDVAFAYKEDALDVGSDQYTISFANSINTYLGGTHVDGMKEGIVKWFRQCVVPTFKGKDKDLQVTPMDITSGLCAFVSIRTPHVVFRAQHKDKLDNQEVKFAVRDTVYETLRDAKHSVTNPMVDFIKRVAKGRVASKKVRRKNVSNAFSKDKPKKYKPINYTINTTSPELLLCEGDSAADLAASARDPENQAIYTIKKPANVFDVTSDDAESLRKTFNEVLDICGLTAGSKCDPSKCTVKYILNLTDGDIDGDQISISMTCLLAKHCRPLIDAGMVGRVLPPAYAIPTGKGKREYVHTQREFFNNILHRFIKTTEIFFEGKNMSKKEIYGLLSDNFDYDLKLNRLAERYCCSPRLMEEIIWNYHGDWSDQKKSYWMKVISGYKDLRILLEHGTVIVDGTIPGYDYINLAMDEHFDKHIRKIKEMQSRNRTISGYTVNGEKSKTLYDVIHEMRSYIPKGVQRFKGLGELSVQEMRELCMDPKTRKVVIFKFKDMENDMDKINVIMSTKRQYVEARSRLIKSLTLSDYDLDT